MAQWKTAELEGIDLRKSSRAVWITIRDIIQETGSRSIGRKTITKRLDGLGLTTLRLATMEMESKGVLKVVHVKIGFSHTLANRYYIFDKDGNEVLADIDPRTEEDDEGESKFRAEMDERDQDGEDTPSAEIW